LEPVGSEIIPEVIKELTPEKKPGMTESCEDAASCDKVFDKLETLPLDEDVTIDLKYYVFLV